MKSWYTLAFLCFTCVCRGSPSCPPLCKCYSRRAEVVCNEVALTEYPSGSLQKNTTMVTIQYTNISSITEDDLSATPQLRELHLYNNHLRRLSSHLLRGVPQLHTLDFTENKLSELPEDVFSHAPLSSLVLKANRLEKVDAKWFPNNSNLTWLDLSGNLLTRIPASLLQKLSHLENLDISDNRVDRIPSNVFSPLSKLERLNLQDNKLASLDAATFQSTSKVLYLFLSRNKLSKLPQNLFQGLTQVRVLSLDDNHLRHIPTGLLDPLTSLDDEGLDLTGNPWLCDGQMKYLWRWIQKNKNKLFLPGTITCARPPSLAGRSIVSLAESELDQS
ncbi:leucine-rich alpha-2-glycoprotein-like [Takifugu rubripes]|uniref:Leucine-rich alpha-2-glycoprotein-like n=1 Tax=Takifugu rubripes TaxID=31033 RepID=H2VBM7_TAKRU|nr:leucine-rich alpha-2-glycoprotein-like [Takifugu rubripes]